MIHPPRGPVRLSRRPPLRLSSRPHRIFRAITSIRFHNRTGSPMATSHPSFPPTLKAFKRSIASSYIHVPRLYATCLRRLLALFLTLFHHGASLSARRPDVRRTWRCGVCYGRVQFYEGSTVLARQQARDRPSTLRTRIGSEEKDARVVAADRSRIPANPT
jgi:hypothetical protein